MSTIDVENTPKLGFGLMRLPKIGEEIDVEQTAIMVDRFLAAGLTYFDTAYVYPGSEEAIAKALVSRYPRDRFTLATKINVNAAPDGEGVRAELEESLRRTGAGYFDYYLLHAIMTKNVDKMNAYGLWDFVKEAKERGLIRHYGFSFHATPELLDQLLTEHPDVEFVQLQINYADWENPDVQSRRCYEVARRHNKPIVVMEPVKGGRLADPPAPIKALFDKAAPGRSYASWAIRFVASLPGILTVLSGMSNVEQMEDNLSYMRDFEPLSEEEQAIIREAMELYRKSSLIPCTACRYCTPGCPMGIPIPDIFAVRNRVLDGGSADQGRREYAEVAASAGKASECIQCGQCESVCPQHIGIIELLKVCARRLEE